MRMREEVFGWMARFPDLLPREPLHPWRPPPDEPGGTHCTNCSGPVRPGDPVAGTYVARVSVVFCAACVRDNRGLLWDWMGRNPLGDA
jgi:hypothetical protein